MNVTAHQEKEKNEETKKGKRRAGGRKKSKQATDSKDAVCCPSAVVQRAAWRKSEGECPGSLGPSGRPTAILTQPKRGRGPHHHVKAAVDWCSYFFFGCDIVTFSFYFIFLIFCVCKVSLFSLNNSIQSIVLEFCYKKILLDLFNFLLQICNIIVMNNDR